MKLNIKSIILILAASASTLALAESKFTIGPGTSATAHLDFSVTIPKFISLQVGALGATINQIDFVVPAANVGDSSIISATAGSGDLGTGSVTAKVSANNGPVTLAVTTLGALSNGVGDTISFAQIATVATMLTTATILPAPVLANGATTSLSLGAGKIVSQDARWTYSYLNSAIVAAGVYGGTNTNNSRVTYTATML